MKRTNRSLRMLLSAGLAVMAVAALSSVAWAAIALTTGQMTKIAPPPSVEIHMLESNTTQFAFDERQCVTLAAALRVSISKPGTYDEYIELTPGLIPAGTLVSSQFIQADRVGIGGPQIVLDGTLTTDAPILGVIVRAAHLHSSDFLGAIGTVYPTGDSERVLQLYGASNDSVTLDPSLQSVTLHTVNSQHTDQVRVITECKLPPPPPTGFEGCTPGYWKQDQHFDSWQVYSPTDAFNAVFGVSGPFPNTLTLLDALNLGGGGVNALARHAVAGLLSSINSDVDYGLTPTEVIDKTKAVINGGDATLIEATKNELAALNEKGCPLN
jgi:hypothetical protein